MPNIVISPIKTRILNIRSSFDDEILNLLLFDNGINPLCLKNYFGN